MTFPFKKDPGNGIILVTIAVNDFIRLKMVLDTGASHTTIDSNALYIADYDLKDAIGVVDIETANGVVETEVFELQKVNGLGITRKKYPVQVYDFLAHGILSNYEGLLGMDFFEGTKFCIDTVRNQISIEPILV
jgi:predicted aspartyl protease